MAANKKRLAQKYCANWNRGICSGIIIKFTQREGKSITTYYMDEKMVGKECQPEGCHYYDTIVLPSLPS